jgi:hypothetical protein
MKMILSMIISVLMFAASGFSAPEEYEYSCFSFYWNGDSNGRGTMSLTLTPKKASADIVEEQWDDEMGLGGDIDTKYRSRGNLEFVKYGDSLIVKKSMLTGGRSLRGGSSGASGGIVRVEGEAEGGFFQYKFICKRN